MKNFISILILGIVFIGCTNTNQNEIDQVDELLSLVKESEKDILMIDTSRVFSMKRQMVRDFKNYTQFTDTVSKEEAFRIDEIFGNKKKFIRFAKNYNSLIVKISHSKEQLNNLKTDLENELMSKEDFLTYYESEKTAFNDLKLKLSKSVGNFNVAIAKYELERKELLELIENRRQRSAANE